MNLILPLHILKNMFNSKERINHSIKEGNILRGSLFFRSVDNFKDRSFVKQLVLEIISIETKTKYDFI